MNFEPNPIKRFTQLYEEVSNTNLQEPSAVTLATASPEGQPSARVVLLKEYDEQGFVFYTNLDSLKAVELAANPHAALCFYWEPIHYQVRVQGEVNQVSDEEADAYFATRARGSQVGAWASKQSATLTSREELEERFREFEIKFGNDEIPRPPFWSGFRLVPARIEFWKRYDNRLHERTLYVRAGAGWKSSLLYP